MTQHVFPKSIPTSLTCRCDICKGGTFLISLDCIVIKKNQNIIKSSMKRTKVMMMVSYDKGGEVQLVVASER